MSKRVTLHWTRRRRGRSKAARRAALPWPEALLLAGVIAVMGVPWIVVPALAPAPENDVHVVQLKHIGDGYRAPFGDGHLELRFIAQRGAIRARIELFERTGERLVPPPSITVHLELPGRGVERTRIAFDRQGAAFVSAMPVRGLVDRSTLVFDDARTRHVYALEGGR